MAASLGMGHEAVFNMLHKILFNLEQEKEQDTAMFSDVCDTVSSRKGTGVHTVLRQNT
jgi:hypothetical protein